MTRKTSAKQEFAHENPLLQITLSLPAAEVINKQLQKIKEGVGVNVSNIWSVVYP